MKITRKLIQTNYTPTKGRKIKYIVMHTYGGRGASLYGWFNEPTTKASAHYAILMNGKIEKYVANKDIAWHVSGAGTKRMPNVSAINAQSIGIEHQDNGAPKNKRRTNKLYASSAQLVYRLHTLYDIPLDKKHILPHNKFANRPCPGGLDLERIIHEANAIKKKEEAKKSKPKPVKEVEEVKEDIEDVFEADYTSEPPKSDILPIKNSTMNSDEKTKSMWESVRGGAKFWGVSLTIGGTVTALLVDPVQLDTIGALVVSGGVSAMINLILSAIDNKFGWW